MTEQKSLIRYLAEAYDRYRAEQRPASRQQASGSQRSRLHWLLRLMVPNVGILLIVAGLLWATNTGALPQSLTSHLHPPISILHRHHRLPRPAGGQH